MNAKSSLYKLLMAMGEHHKDEVAFHMVTKTDNLGCEIIADNAVEM